MAAGETAVSFDEIIQADRLRRKNEALAKEIFGRGRKLGTAGNGTSKVGSGYSFASKAGIVKESQRPSPASSRTRPLAEKGVEVERKPKSLRASRRDSPLARSFRNDRLFTSLKSQTSRNGKDDEMNVDEPVDEISIRGLAGPYVVIASNFAPGTTAADIESAMVPNGGEIQACKLITYSPTVTAEMIFAERINAETVIANFNNKKADGRILHLYMKQVKQGSLIATAPPPPNQASQEPKTAQTDLIHPELSRPEFSFDSQRERSDRNRRRANPDLQDGRFGFGSSDERMEVDVGERRSNWRGDQRESERRREIDVRDERGLYSDNLYPRPRGRGFR